MDQVKSVSRATIRDVSRMAGVSIKTVSRVINHEKYVTAETRTRVEQAMAQLSFQPSFAARALKGHRSHQIAVICDNPSPWYVYEVQSGVRARCQLNRVRMIAQPYDRASPTLFEDVMSLMDQVHPDGLILTPPACDDLRVLEELLRRRVPFVRLQPGIRPEMSSSTFINNETAAFQMTSHLLALGHRRVGFIVGDLAYAASEQRLAGYKRALSEMGLVFDTGLIQPGKFDFPSGKAAARILLTLPDRPTAIFASNDDMAAGTLTTAHEMKIAVPENLSVVGFDDTAVASIVWPTLTTVRQPVRALAEAAAELLLESTGGIVRREIEYELILRDSAGAKKTVDKY